ncbi:MAG: two-component sensor histidine kinase [Thermoleophilia bacterium]|nr:two-component sensor histidine kinase [Thermoleophilia bacterium]
MATRRTRRGGPAVTLREIARAIAVQQTPPAILQAAVDGAKQALQTDVTFGAIASQENGAYSMSATHGAFGPRFREIVIPPMIGLGGRVAVVRRPMAVHDYLTDRVITKDFVDIVVREEGLRGIACVPVIASTGVEALLYAGLRSPGFLADNALDTLEEISNYAGIAIDQALAHARREELGLLRERQRLAADLHDSVAQVLFTIGVEAKRSRVDGDPARLQGALSEIESLAAEAGRELRETLHRINAVPESLALEAVLEAEARLFETATDRTVRIICRGTSRSISQPHESVICDVVREGLRNAAKHTVAELIVVHLYYGDDDVRLAVQTDGAGTRPGALGAGADLDREYANAERGGLALLRPRVEVLRGRLELELGEEGETVLRVRLPYAAA